MRVGGVWLLTVPVLLAAACTSGTSGSGHSTSDSPLPTYPFPSYSTRPASPATSGPNVRPGEKPPTLPPATNDTTGAIAFARYWEETIDWGYATVDSTLPRTAFSHSCDGCTKFMKTFDGARADGVRFRGGRFNILTWASQPNDHRNGATAVVDVTFAIEALEAIDRTGKVVESDPAHPRVTDRIWMRWTGSNWTVVDWRQVVEK